MTTELRFMGNQYVRDEFRRHKDSKPEYIPGFIKEWTNYRDMMSAQAGSNIVGAKLKSEIMDQLSSEQLGQLYELRSATKSIGLK